MAEYWIHVANVIYLASYLVRDILVLRLLTVAGALTLLPFYIFRAEPLWAAVAWNGVFTAINVYRIQRLVSERKPVRLSAAESALHDAAFSTMAVRDFYKLLGAGRWASAPADTCLVKQGEPVADLVVLSSGSVAIRVGDREVAALGAGSFLGEMSYLTGEPTSASVWTREQTEYVAWARSRLDALFADSPEVQAGVQRAIGADLAHKIKRNED